MHGSISLAYALLWTYSEPGAREGKMPLGQSGWKGESEREGQREGQREEERGREGGEGERERCADIIRKKRINKIKKCNSLLINDEWCHWIHAPHPCQKAFYFGPVQFLYYEFLIPTVSYDFVRLFFFFFSYGFIDADGHIYLVILLGRYGNQHQ